MAPEPMDSPARIEIATLNGNISILKLLQKSLVIESLTINRPVFTAKQLPDKTIALPWNPSPASAQPTPVKDSSENRSIPRLVIEKATLDNGAFKLQGPDSDQTISYINGLTLSLSLDLTAKLLDAICSIDKAQYVMDDNSGLMTLTDELTLHMTRENGPITVQAQTELNHFPISVNGQITPEASPLQYSAQISGDGPVQRLLAHYLPSNILIPEAQLTMTVKSTETVDDPVPEMNVTITSRHIVVHEITIQSAIVRASAGKHAINGRLNLITGTGELNLDLLIPDYTTDTPWTHTLTANNFPIETLTPWLPEPYAVHGILDGQFHLTGTPENWDQAQAESHIQLSQSNVADSLSESTLLVPTGNIDFTYNQGQYVAEIDTHTRLSGTQNSGSATIHSILTGKWNSNERFTMTGNGKITLQELVINNDEPVSGSVDVVLENQRFQADFSDVSRGSLRAQGTASGDILADEQGRQTINISLDELLFSNNPTRKLEMLWQQDREKQLLTVTTDTSDLDALLIRQATPQSTWEGTIALNQFQLDPLATLLPEPWNSSTGNVSGQVTLSGTSVTTTLQAFKIKVLNHLVTSINQSKIRYDSGQLEICNLVILADDNSRLSVNGQLGIQDHTKTLLQAECDIPDLGSWHIDALDPISGGAVHAQLELSGLWPELIPEGSVSVTGLTSRTMSVGNTELRAMGTTLDGALQLTCQFDELKKNSSNLTVSGTSNLTVSNWNSPAPDWLVDMVITRMICRSGNHIYQASVPTSVILADNHVAIPGFDLIGPEFELNISGKLPIGALSEDEQTGELLSVNLAAAMEPFSSLDAEIGDLSGRVTCDLAIASTLTEPVVTGYTTFHQIYWDSPLLPGPIENLNGRLLVTETAVTLKDTAFTFAGGPILVQGGVTRNGFSPDEVDINLKAQEIDIDYTSDLQIQGNADLWFKGRWPETKIGGIVHIDEALYTPEIDLIDLLMTLPEQTLVIADSETPLRDKASEELTESTGFPMEITVVAHDDIRIENPHMHLDLSGRLQLTGTTKLPGLLGSVTFNEGFIDLLLHEFEITSGSVNFTSPYDLNPGLDIIATTPVKDDIITLQITGNADKPNLLLSSESGKSHAEIMRMLLGSDSLGSSDDLETMAQDYATQAAAMAAAEAISARTDLIIVPFPESLEDEDLLLGVGRKFGERWTVMYYIGEKSDEGNVIEVELEVNPKSELRFRQNQDGSISGGIRYHETFN